MTRLVFFNGKKVYFDNLQIQEIDRVDHSIFYTCTGYDDLGRQYEGTAEYCCDEFEAITDIEMVSHMHHNRKPYQARVLLKSIKYWQLVVGGKLQAKRPMAYYKNKLDYYTESDIIYLTQMAAK
jgi:hypothetical protein